MWFWLSCRQVWCASACCWLKASVHMTSCYWCSSMRPGDPAGVPRGTLNSPRMQEGKVAEPARNRSAAGGSHHLSTGAHRAAGGQQEDAPSDPDGTASADSKHHAPAAAAEAASGQQQEPGNASQPKADVAAVQELGAEHVGAAAASAGASGSVGRPSDLGVELEGTFEAVAHKPASGPGKLTAPAAGAGKAGAPAAEAGKVQGSHSEGGAAGAPAEQGCGAALLSSLPMTRLESTAVGVSGSQATEDAQPGGSSAKQHGHQAEVVQAVGELAGAGSESDATEAAAGVIENGVAAYQEALPNGGALHATEGGGGDAQAQLTRTVLQQHETGMSQVGAAMHPSVLGVPVCSTARRACQNRQAA